MQLVLLIVVAVSVLALICITKKSRTVETEEFSARPVTADARSVTATPTDICREEEIPDDSSVSATPAQNTIYEYSSNNKHRICPFCDGENSVKENLCIICGMDI